MKKIKNILILAGGDSTRFWPLENKNLFSFVGRPLIQHQTENLNQFGENIVIVAHKDNIKEIRKYCPFKAIAQRDNLLGQAGAIISAKDLISGGTLIVNANDIFNPEVLLQFNIKLEQKKRDCIFLAKKMNNYFPGGYWKFKNGKPAELLEKPQLNKTPSNLVNIVVHYFKDFQRLVKTLLYLHTAKDDWYEQGINKVLNQTKNIEIIVYDDYWYTLKYPWHVLPMMRHFLSKLEKNKISSSAKISKNALIIGPVYIGENVRIGDFTKIVGPCYIGERSVIGDYVMVRESQIREGCLVGGYSEVVRSYLDNNVSLHRNYVGDSVLAEGVLMGANALTANFRFDGTPIKSQLNEEKINTSMIKLGAIIGCHSKIGVNSTILPGVKIGKKTFIGPGEVVDKDVEDKIFLFKKRRKKNLLVY